MIPRFASIIPVDQASLEDVGSYITAENLNNKLQTEHLLNLDYMPTENPNNPLYQLVLEILIDSDTFVNVLSKASTKVQDRVLNAMVNFSEKGWGILKDKVGKLGLFKSLISIGFGLGGAMQLSKFFIPDWTDKAKQGAYQLVDKVTAIGKSAVQEISSVVDCVAESIARGASNIKDKASQILDDLIPEIKIPKLDFGWFS